MRKFFLRFFGSGALRFGPDHGERVASLWVYTKMSEPELSDMQRMKKRSISIAGHRTSISLEGAFWLMLRHLAREREVSISRLVAEIDRSRTGNLSSAIRVYLLAEVGAGRIPGLSAKIFEEVEK